jgi:hypothetical protein
MLAMQVFTEVRLRSYPWVHHRRQHAAGVPGEIEAPIEFMHGRYRFLF